MKVIDSDNYAASGIETFFFPGGEPHARIPKDFGPALLFLKARTWNDFGLALCVLNALRQQSLAPTWVFAAYLPGARQDRTDGQTPMTCEIYLTLLKRYSDRVYTFDAHSSVTSHKVHKNFTICDLIREHAKGAIWASPDNAYIIAPDFGSNARATGVSAAQGLKHAVIQCEKHREFSTGTFTGFTMPPLPGPGSYLICDDICDGGGTFNLLAAEFKKDQYAVESTLSLWVSHGIFSKGIWYLDESITDIGTTDSWYRGVSDERVTVLPLQPLIDKILEDADV